MSRRLPIEQESYYDELSQGMMRRGMQRYERKYRNRSRNTITSNGGEFLGSQMSQQPSLISLSGIAGD